MTTEMPDAPFFNSEICRKYFKEDTASNKILSDFILQLSADKQKLNDAFIAKDDTKVSFLLDKMLEACLYCGTQRLFQVLTEFHKDPLTDTGILLINNTINSSIAAINLYLTDE